MAIEVILEEGPNMITLMRASRGQLQQRERLLLKQIQENQRELKRVRAQITHLDGFLSLEEGKTSDQGTTAIRSSGEEICNMVETILLQNENAPMHYRALTEEVQNRGVVIGGIDPERTLLSNIAKDDRFHRPAKRGQYAIRVERLQQLAQLENEPVNSVDTEADSNRRSSSPNQGEYGEWGPASNEFRPPADVGEIPF